MQPTSKNVRQHTTNYINRTLYPKWNEDNIYFPIEQTKYVEEETLHVHLWDHDTQFNASCKPKLSNSVLGVHINISIYLINYCNT